MKFTLNRASMLFSLNSFVAAMAALFIGFSLGLPRPYWAMTTAYIVSQPLAGAVRSKAVYRVFGTLLGAAAAVALVPNLVNSPLVLSFALALWVGVCLFISLMDRTPRSYLLMLAGYTAAIIGFPSVTAPGGVFDVAVARFEEITLGILCAAVVHSIVFPLPVGKVIAQRIGAWLDDADRWALDVLSGKGDDHIERDRRQLAAAAVDIRLLATHLPFDASRLAETTATVRALHDHMLLLTPVLSGLNDRIKALHVQGTSPSPQAQSAMDEVAAWIKAGVDYEAAQPILARLRAITNAVTPQAGWRELLETSLAARLIDLIDALRGGRLLLGYIRGDLNTLPAPLREEVAAATARPLHRDVGMAALSGAAATVAVFLVCLVWILSGWPDGASAAAMAAVFCCFFASLDDPAPAIVNFGLFTLISLPIAILYEFAVLPQIDGFPMLAMTLAPPLLLFGLFVATPRYAGSAMAVIMGFCNALALQEAFTPDFASFLNVNLAQFVGLFAAITVTRMMRTISVDASAQRLLRQTWRNLARQTRGGDIPTPTDLAALLVDRLGLLTPKLATAGENRDFIGVDALRDLRIGMNLTAIQLARPTMAPAATQAAGRLLTAVGDHFAALPSDPSRRPAESTLSLIDDALARSVSDDASPDRLSAVTGLVGLRRNLFPDAAPYAPPVIAEHAA